MSREDCYLCREEPSGQLCTACELSAEITQLKSENAAIKKERDQLLLRLSDEYRMIETLEQRANYLESSGIHTCRENCQRRECVQSREIEKLKLQTQDLCRVIDEYKSTLEAISGCEDCKAGFNAQEKVGHYESIARDALERVKK